MMGAIGRMIGRVPLGPVAALLLGLAGGFLAWAVPAVLLGAIVRHLHVAAVLPQAAPPYSPLTRIVLAVVAGLVLAAIVLVGFRRLENGRWPWSREVEDQAEAEVVDEPPAPRLRRADRHPDAPARRPLFAKELLLDTPFGEPEAEPQADLVQPAPIIRRGSPVVEAEPVTEVVDASVIEEVPVAALPSRAVDASPLPIVPPKPVRPPTSGASVAELMARLEAGLVRHDRVLPASPPAADVPLGDALRDALADLQKMARR